MQPERSKNLAEPASTRAPKPGAFEARRIEACDPRADGRRRVVVLRRDRVMIARSVAGVFMHIETAAAAYRGVALRLNALADGAFHYQIQLVHRDPDLCVILHEAHDDSEIQAEWRLWARFLGLPALIEGEGGRVEADSGQTGGPARARRRGRAMLSRRPRFLQRRRMGVARDPAEKPAPTREIFPGSKLDR